MENKIDDYILQHTSPEDPTLYDLYRETHLKVLNPRMLSGHLQGKILSMFSEMIKPQYILEIGTYTGYSAICLAKGLQENGKLHTIEVNDELNEIALRYFKKANLFSRIELFNGDALEIIKGLDFRYDIVFIDAEKTEYSKYYQLVFDKVKSGGFVIADNTLWDGKVADNNINDETTEALRNFNQMIKTDSRVEVVILPVRDGLSVIRKK